ncbi:DUF2934 domain-containing protein [Azospirillaceae bacterium]
MAKKEHIQNEMTLEEAKAYRASLYKPSTRALTEQEKRESFRLFWAKARRKYKQYNHSLEQILWIHLKASGYDTPEKFDQGIEHFGLKKVG